MLFANLSGENGTAENCMIYNRAAKIQFMLLFWVFVLVGFWLGFFVSFGVFFNEKQTEFSASLFLF